MKAFIVVDPCQDYDEIPHNVAVLPTLDEAMGALPELRHLLDTVRGRNGYHNQPANELCLDIQEWDGVRHVCTTSVYDDGRVKNVEVHLTDGEQRALMEEHRRIADEMAEARKRSARSELPHLKSGESAVRGLGRIGGEAEK
ncbi:hypothetical protein SEA_REDWATTLEHOG_107 [Gordonia phage RedWattleHog]|uniref:Uncharacterized protein n=1 Tax=Gordonia phage Stormageddon TaxID=2656541 RepID=A0A649VR70_9CAUD|nr:hypothetical protein KHQ86_gp194 [Gordonia phage Stormageddon]QGJ94966.1 hypothetical protein SEA_STORMAGEDDON_106 [Gordonia phage Stormageddon]QLF83610.1 hypothetical protein SEA_REDWATTLEHOG_107 [Gordonia phage RedWattleHog]